MTEGLLVEAPMRSGRAGFSDGRSLWRGLLLGRWGRRPPSWWWISGSVELLLRYCRWTVLREGKIDRWQRLRKGWCRVVCGRWGWLRDVLLLRRATTGGGAAVSDSGWGRRKKSEGGGGWREEGKNLVKGEDEWKWGMVMADFCRVWGSYRREMVGASFVSPVSAGERSGCFGWEFWLGGSGGCVWDRDGF